MAHGWWKGGEMSDRDIDIFTAKKKWKLEEYKFYTEFDK